MTALLIISVLFNAILVFIAQSHADEKKSLEEEAIRRGYGKREHRRFVWLEN